MPKNKGGRPRKKDGTPEQKVLREYWRNARKKNPLNLGSLKAPLLNKKDKDALKLGEIKVGKITEKR